MTEQDQAKAWWAEQSTIRVQCLYTEAWDACDRAKAWSAKQELARRGLPLPAHQWPDSP